MAEEARYCQFCGEKYMFKFDDPKPLALETTKVKTATCSTAAAIPEYVPMTATVMASHTCKKCGRINYPSNDGFGNISVIVR